jgi:hypothetical protein
MLNMFSREEDKLQFGLYLFVALLVFLVLFFYKAPKPKDKSNCDLYCTEIAGTILKSSFRYTRRTGRKEYECQCTVLNSDSAMLHLKLGVRSTGPCPKVGDEMLKGKNSFYVITVRNNVDTSVYYDMKRGCE